MCLIIVHIIQTFPENWAGRICPAATVTLTVSLTLIVFFFPQKGRRVSWFTSHLLVGEQNSIVLAVFMTPNVL